MKRIAGFYWVRLHSEDEGDPVVAYWDEDHLSWLLVGEGHGWHEGHFVQLSTRLSFE